MKRLAAIALCALSASAVDMTMAGSTRWGVASPLTVMPSSQWSESTATGCVLWITFDQTNRLDGATNVQWDASRTQNDIRQGTATNTPAIVQRVSAWDGTDRMHGRTQDLSGAFTVSCWAKDTQTDSNNVSVIASDYRTAAGIGWYLGFYQRRARLFITAQTNSANSKLTVSQVLSSGVWYHVCASWSGIGTDAVSLAINSTNTGTASLNSYIGTPPGVQSNLQVGARNMTSPDSFFVGYMDDLRIRRRVLSTAEITNEYQWTRGASRP